LRGHACHSPYQGETGYHHNGHVLLGSALLQFDPPGWAGQPDHGLHGLNIGLHDSLEETGGTVWGIVCALALVPIARLPAPVPSVGVRASREL